MTGLDTTILVQLSDRHQIAHSAARNLVDSEIKAGLPLLLTPQVITEFLHVITDNRRFENPLSMIDALAWIDDLLQIPGIRLQLPTARSINLASEWMRRFNLGRKRILDTHLAATLHVAGCNRILTSNPDDFRIFDAFLLVSP